MLATHKVHGKAKPHLARWQAEQAAQQEISKYQFRAPSFWLYRDDPKHRANVTVYLTLKNNIVETANVVLTHHRTERRYNHITIASLKRLSSIAPLPLLTADQFAAMDEAMVAAEMLAAGRAQQERTVKCPVCGKWARREDNRYYHLEVKSLATGERVGDKQLFCQAERISPIPDTAQINVQADADLVVANMQEVAA